MPKFNYDATNKQGRHQIGTVEAEDRDNAIKQLGKQGLVPSSIKKEGGFDPNNIKIPFLSRKKIKSKDLVIFTRQLSTMVNAGVPLVRSLVTLREQTESVILKEVVNDLAKDVESGHTLTEAMTKHPEVFSSIYTNMVAAGEAGGILDDILKRLAMQQEKDDSIKKKIKSASIYPMVLLVITVVAFFGLMLFIVPQIGGLIKDVGGEDATLPFYTEAMLNFSDFAIKFWYIFVIVIFAAVFIFRRWVKTKRGRRAFHKFLLRVPVIKTVITKVAIARFSRIFASLMGAGVGVLDTIRVTARAIGNVVIEEELLAAADEVKNGKQLSEPLSESSVFPPIVAQMLAVGEETGQMDTVLVKVADFYEEEVDAVIDGLSSIIEPIMIVVLGGMVGLVALSVMGPLSSISQNIH